MKLPRTLNHLPTCKDMPQNEPGSKGLLFHAREQLLERAKNSYATLHEISTLSMSFTQRPLSATLARRVA